MEKHSMDWYRGLDLTAPRRGDFLTYFCYSLGKCVFTGTEAQYLAATAGNQLDGTLLEKVCDEKSWRAELALYHTEVNHRREQFKNHLFTSNGVDKHPLAEKAYAAAKDLASEYGDGTLDDIDDIFARISVLLT